MDDQGNVDYATGLNEQLKGDIKPEENAMALMAQVIPPNQELTRKPPEFYRWLEIEEPKENAPFLQRYAITGSEYPDLKIYVITEKCMQPWAKIDFPDEAEFLQANQEPLQILSKAAERTKYFHPVVTTNVPEKHTSIDVGIVDFLNRQREAANFLNMRAMNAIQEKRFDDAWNDFYTIHRMGRLIQSNPSGFMEDLIGLSIERIAIKGYEVLLSTQTWSVDQIKVKAEFLNKLPTPASPAFVLDQHERLIILDTIQVVYAAKNFQYSSKKYHVVDDAEFYERMVQRSIDFDSLLRRVNAKIDRIVVAMSIPDNSDRFEAMEKIKKENFTIHFIPWKMQLHGITKRSEMIGQWMLQKHLYTIYSIERSASRRRNLLKSTQIAFAIAEYQAREGKYPEKLIDLKLPVDVTLDIYTGKQLHYERWNQGYILCSLGIEEKWKPHLEQARLGGIRLGSVDE
ncbi:MAG: hypothetical protein R3B84_23705 [Zavarzinella sp.]